LASAPWPNLLIMTWEMHAKKLALLSAL